MPSQYPHLGLLTQTMMLLKTEMQSQHQHDFEVSDEHSKSILSMDMKG